MCVSIFSKVCLLFLHTIPIFKVFAQSPTFAPSSACEDICDFASADYYGSILGPCYNFTFSGSNKIVNACGYNTTTGVPTDLRNKNQSSIEPNESGVGIQAGFPGIWEITMDSFIQIDISTMESPAYYMMGSTDDVEYYCIFGSNVQGYIGDVEFYRSVEQGTFLSFPTDWKSYTYISFTTCDDNTLEIADVLIAKFKMFNAAACKSVEPTLSPSITPSRDPTYQPSCQPSYIPTVMPSIQPSTPTVSPSINPTVEPSFVPTRRPSAEPTLKPTKSPTVVPSIEPSAPTETPSYVPSVTPSFFPSVTPTEVPSIEPSAPTSDPTFRPSKMPTYSPSFTPSVDPTYIPTRTPSYAPSIQPSTPTVTPTAKPSITPSYSPSITPTSIPSIKPSTPTSSPSVRPTRNPSILPSAAPIPPTVAPSAIPTLEPSDSPTIRPSRSPTITPTRSKRYKPTKLPITKAPSPSPSILPTSDPTILNQPSSMPVTIKPSTIPTINPSDIPTAYPTTKPSLIPSYTPSYLPSITPVNSPSYLPSYAPTTIGGSLIKKCELYTNPNTLPVYNGFFIVHQFLNNTASSQFRASGVNESFVQAVQCAMSGNYSIGNVKVNITDITTISATDYAPSTSGSSSAETAMKASKITTATSFQDISARKLTGLAKSVSEKTPKEAETEIIIRDFTMTATTIPTSLVDIRYIVEFLFTVPNDLSASNAYDEIATYFQGLVSQFTTKILNDDFTVIFQQYLLANNVDMITSGSGGNSDDLSSSKLNVQPDYFGPYLFTRLPTTSPVSESLGNSNAATNQIWSKLAVILGTTFGILCICCIILAIFLFYLRRKRQRESDMETWQAGHEGDIHIHKKNSKFGRDSRGESYDGENPAFEQDNHYLRGRSVSVVTRAIDTVKRMSIRVTKSNKNSNNNKNRASSPTSSSSAAAAGGFDNNRSSPPDKNKSSKSNKIMTNVFDAAAAVVTGLSSRSKKNNNSKSNVLSAQAFMDQLDEDNEQGAGLMGHSFHGNSHHSVGNHSEIGDDDEYYNNGVSSGGYKSRVAAYDSDNDHSDDNDDSHINMTDIQTALTASHDEQNNGNLLKIKSNNRSGDRRVRF